MDMFEAQAEEAMAESRPLAERMRPRSLDDFVGQEEAVGKGTLLREAIDRDRLFSIILWGPPGCLYSAPILCKPMRLYKF